MHENGRSAYCYDGQSLEAVSCSLAKKCSSYAWEERTFTDGTASIPEAPTPHRKDFDNFPIAFVETFMGHLAHVCFV